MIALQALCSWGRGSPLSGPRVTRSAQQQTDGARLAPGSHPRWPLGCPCCCSPPLPLPHCQENPAQLLVGGGLRSQNPQAVGQGRPPWRREVKRRGRYWSCLELSQNRAPQGGHDPGKRQPFCSWVKLRLQGPPPRPLLPDCLCHPHPSPISPSVCPPPLSLRKGLRMQWHLLPFLSPWS